LTVRRGLFSHVSSSPRRIVFGLVVHRSSPTSSARSPRAWLSVTHVSGPSVDTMAKCCSMVICRVPA
jgi:hypothetical protein